MDYLTLTAYLLAMLAVSSTSKPNIIFILTDDQDIVLGGLTPMEKTKRLIADEGVSFENAFVTTPLCCPSRSSILSGQYVTNHGAHNNSLSGGCSSPSWQQTSEQKTYGALLHDSGYRTFYAGKYLNQYGYKGSGGTEHVPKGWDWWIGLVGNSVYYNYTLSVNGSAVSRGDAQEDYLTDVVKDYALQFLRQSQIINGEVPFLMAVNPPSAHAPFTPAERHEGKFSNISAPRTPNFNVPVNRTKHWLTRLPPEILPQSTIDNIDEVYRNRWETLLAVDEMVEDIVLRLDSLGLLNNTYVIFSSDHGFHFGQFALTWDKRHPYEFDIKIPLMVRGPNVPKNVTARTPVLNIDIAPTLMDIAGLRSPADVDGSSLLPILNRTDETYWRVFVVEYTGESSRDTKKAEECYDDLDLTLCAPESSCKCFDSRNNTYTCIRSYGNGDDLIYCSFDDDEKFEEFYNLGSDPHQLDNQALLKEQKLTWKYKHALNCMSKGTPRAECINLITEGIGTSPRIVSLK